MTNRQKTAAPNRRKADVHLWEKRTSLWLIALLVTTCTGILIEIRADFKVLTTELTYVKKEDTRQAIQIGCLEEDQELILRVQRNHSSRLASVEDKLKIEPDNVIPVL